MMDVPDSLRSRLSLPTRAAFRIIPKLFPQVREAYRLNLFAGQPEA